MASEEKPRPMPGDAVMLCTECAIVDADVSPNPDAFAWPVVMPAAFLEAKSPVTCRCSRPQASSQSSASRPPRRSASPSRRRRWPPPERWCGSKLPYFIQLGLKAEWIERAQRQRGESANAPVQHQVGIFEREGDLSRRAAGFCRVRDTPVRRHWLAGPRLTLGR
jgi:hypothetical protein